MVQIVEPNDALSQVGKALGPISDAFGNFAQRRRESQQKEESFDASEKNYNTIKDAFGERFADVWKAAPTGARTELLKSGIDANLRGMDIRKIFGQEGLEQPDQQEQSRESNQFPEYKLDTTGRSPKENVAFQKELRGFNDPVYRESRTKKKSLDKQLKSFNDLKRLSPHIPQGFSRFFYDKEGNIRPLAQTLKAVPPEAEEYVKIINDFTTQAKDSYGSRVTNFDLQQFLRRLPTLANSEEGRDLIIDRMQIQTKADEIFEDALQKVYRHYGLGKITPEDAEEIAESIAEPQIEALRQRSEELDSEMDALSPGKQNQDGFVSMKDPQGRILRVPKDKVEELTRLGASPA